MRCFFRGFCVVQHGAQRGGAGVEADIGADRPCGEALLETVRLEVDEVTDATLPIPFQRPAHRRNCPGRIGGGGRNSGSFSCRSGQFELDARHDGNLNQEEHQ